MSLFSNPTFRKWLVGIGSTVLTVTAGQAVMLRDQVLNQEQRLQAAEKVIQEIPEMRADLAVLRDRSDREWEKRK